MRFRFLHDFFHVAIVAFSLIVVLAPVNPRVEAIVERVDLFIHVLLVGLAFESARDWMKRRRTTAKAPKPCKPGAIHEGRGQCCPTRRLA